MTGPAYRKVEEEIPKILAAIPHPQTEAATKAQEAVFAGVKEAIPQKVKQATTVERLVTTVAGDFDKVIKKSGNTEVLDAWKNSSLCSYLV